MENGFSSPRNGAFPAGLRVLVVDDDPTWLKILEKMLKKCSYEVTICGLAREALNLLRERKDRYDIVISDVNMPDMDGFKLLEHVGLEMDLPVIMMSVDGETSRVMKGVQHGACDYLLKPIRMKELQNIWQHVFRKRIHEIRDIETLEGIKGIQVAGNGSDQPDDGHLLFGEDLTPVKKRRDFETKHDEKDLGDSSSSKKARVVWSVDLHQKFVKAVNQIGFDKVGPKKILDLMNVPWLTRENVASHLQKYRLYLSRLQKENDLKNSASQIKHSDSPSRDSSGSSGIENSINMQHNDVSIGSYDFSGNSSLLHDVDPSRHDSDQKGIVSMPMVEPKRDLPVDVLNPHKLRRAQMELGRSFTSLESEVNFASFDFNFPTQYPWCEIPEVQLKQEHELLHLGDAFTQIELPGQQQHIQVSSGPSRTEREVGGTDKIKHLCDEYRSSVNHVSVEGSLVDSSHDQTKTPVTNYQAVESVASESLKNQVLSLSCTSDLESAQKNIAFGMSPLANLNEDFQFCWVWDDGYNMNLGAPDIESSDYHHPGLIAEFPIDLYDAPSFDYDNLYGPTEHPLVDQGLSIA